MTVLGSFATVVGTTFCPDVVGTGIATRLDGGAEVVDGATVEVLLECIVDVVVGRLVAGAGGMVVVAIEVVATSGAGVSTLVPASWAPEHAVRTASIAALAPALRSTNRLHGFHSIEDRR